MTTEAIRIADPSEGVSFGLGNNESILVTDLLREVRECKAALDEWKSIQEKTPMNPRPLDGILQGVGTSIPGQQIRETALVDTPEGFRLTLLVDVRHEDVAEAADLLKRGRALQAAFDRAHTAQVPVYGHPYVPGRVTTCPVCDRDNADCMPADDSVPAGLAPIDPTCPGCRKVREP